MKANGFYVVAIMMIIFGGILMALGMTEHKVTFLGLWGIISISVIGIGVAVAAVLPLPEGKRDNVHNAVLIASIMCAIIVLLCTHKHFEDVIEVITVMYWAIGFMVCGAILTAVPSFISRKE